MNKNNPLLLVQALMAGLNVEMPSVYVNSSGPKKPNPEVQATAEAKRARKNAKRKMNK